ncbi:alpha/beta fold hydrolase [Corynebacterium striatum]|uniref:Hydrolase n=1 Tax=Corynebacterium striatum TaxID=43770 RepID=A0AAQ1TTK1_CORST|nr:alpha/beta hydrolase [Corynebacterium striatum]EEI77857.1 hydrolase, alpha/beta domain protein [Corynebacterium striatum ATCC 6940]QQE52514.1 alpha/beta hydrolase [Corynebacterium striatum]STD34031.1 hydrolase [Corynebacterium striatum]STD56798.1 hydrolase [Corynebacterium striatum]GEA42627.1 hydrolase [Corynebacterium striatum]
MAQTPAPLPPSVVELEGPFTHEFVHTRGIRLHAATAGSPSDPLVLLLHGSFGGWFDFKDVIAPIAEQGFHVAALDMRGFGMSDKPPVEVGQDIRAMVGDITGAIQALGHDSAYLVGADSGGAIAWAVACERPERTLGLVSVSASHPVDLRRAMAARPWDFGWLLLRAGLCRLAGPIRRHNPLMRPSTYEKELALNTDSKFPAECRGDVAKLRIQASQIGNVRRGILWNHRMRTAVPPLSWIDSKVEAPVLYLHPKQQLWRPLVRRAEKRTASAFRNATIAQTKNLPHIESPEAFATMVSEWLNSHDCECAK